MTPYFIAALLIAVVSAIAFVFTRKLKGKIPDSIWVICFIFEALILLTSLTFALCLGFL